MAKKKKLERPKKPHKAVDVIAYTHSAFSDDLERVMGALVRSINGRFSIIERELKSLRGEDAWL